MFYKTEVNFNIQKLFHKTETNFCYSCNDIAANFSMTSPPELLTKLGFKLGWSQLKPIAWMKLLWITSSVLTNLLPKKNEFYFRWLKILPIHLSWNVKIIEPPLFLDKFYFRWLKLIRVSHLKLKCQNHWISYCTPFIPIHLQSKI